MKMSVSRMQQILMNAPPSCGVINALHLPDNTIVTVLVSMTAEEWRELSPEYTKRLKT